MSARRRARGGGAGVGVLSSYLQQTQTVPTVLPNNTMTVVSNATGVFVFNNGVSAKVVTPNLTFCNGIVVHTINNVLLPPAQLAQARARSRSRAQPRSAGDRGRPRSRACAQLSAAIMAMATPSPSPPPMTVLMSGAAASTASMLLAVLLAVLSLALF